MRANQFISIGAALTVLGFIGLVLIFPNFIATSGQDFVAQIDTSKGIEEYEDYSIGDSVTIVDEIARIELNEGQTYIWLESIGKSQTDPPFRFGSDLMSDYGVGNKVIITFEVVKDSTGDYTLDGYQDGGSGLSSDSINGRYSTITEYLFILLVAGGLGSIGYGIFSSFTSKKATGMGDDGWGDSIAPAPISPPAMQIPPAVPPGMAPAPSVGAPTAPVAEPMPLAPSPPVATPPSPSSMTITVPPGVVPGQILTVTMPSGTSVNVQVPPGCPPGSQFTITVTQ